MPEFERKRARMIEYLKAALVLADDLKDNVTGYLIETALDQSHAERVARNEVGQLGNLAGDAGEQELAIDQSKKAARKAAVLNRYSG